MVKNYIPRFSDAPFDAIKVTPTSRRCRKERKKVSWCEKNSLLPRREFFFLKWVSRVRGNRNLLKKNLFFCAHHKHIPLKNAKKKKKKDGGTKDQEFFPSLWKWNQSFLRIPFFFFRESRSPSVDECHKVQTSCTTFIYISKRVPESGSFFINRMTLLRKEDSLKCFSPRKKPTLITRV